MGFVRSHSNPIQCYENEPSHAYVHGDDWGAPGFRHKSIWFMFSRDDRLDDDSASVQRLSSYWIASVDIPQDPVSVNFGTV